MATPRFSILIPTRERPETQRIVEELGSPKLAGLRHVGDAARLAEALLPPVTEYLAH
jgi:hypothetical protein